MTSLNEVTFVRKASDASLACDLVNPGPPSPNISGDGMGAATGTLSRPIKELSLWIELINMASRAFLVT